MTGNLEAAEDRCEVPTVRPAGRVPTVLVAERDDSLREEIVAVLASEGYGVAAAGTARGAVEEIERLTLEAWSCRAVDLVLADVRLPGLGGLYVVDMLRRAHFPIRAVLMTDCLDTVVRSDAELYQVSVLQKPFTADALRVSVYDLVGRPPRKRISLVARTLPPPPP